MIGRLKEAGSYVLLAALAIVLLPLVAIAAVIFAIAAFQWFFEGPLFGGVVLLVVVGVAWLIIASRD